ncbi:MAG: tRNA(Ile)(2)-agmatinylcytidine synthase [Sulfolobaceae archaeon]
MKLIIGIDDHDSPEGGCTTHFATLLIEKFKKITNLKIIDLPYLIRLNPNVPWKTRGNGAVTVKIETERSIEEILDIVWNESVDYVEKVSRGFKYDRKPGVVVIPYSEREQFFQFYIKALSDIITNSTIKDIISKFNVKYRGSRGVIGSLAAIGFKGNITYEIIYYRKYENIGKDRKININNLLNFDRKYFPITFANYDYIKGIPLITPKGNDPVLFGIRVTNLGIIDPDEIRKIAEEEVDKIMIFKTNQGTDAHLVKPGEKPYQTFYGVVTVKEVKVLEGGDVLISTNEGMDIIVFKETGELNIGVRELERDDVIKVIGAVKPSFYDNNVIIEAERIEILKLVPKYNIRNPKCPYCGSSSESLGKNKGFRCKRCNRKFYKEKEMEEVARSISVGVYQTRYYRHLTRPLFLEPTNDEFEYDLDSVLSKFLR